MAGNAATCHAEPQRGTRLTAGFSTAQARVQAARLQATGTLPGGTLPGGTAAPYVSPHSLFTVVAAGSASCAADTAPTKGRLVTASRIFGRRMAASHLPGGARTRVFIPDVAPAPKDPEEVAEAEAAAAALAADPTDPYLQLAVHWPRLPGTW